MLLEGVRVVDGTEGPDGADLLAEERGEGDVGVGEAVGLEVVEGCGAHGAAGAGGGVVVDGGNGDHVVGEGEPVGYCYAEGGCCGSEGEEEEEEGGWFGWEHFFFLFFLSFFFLGAIAWLSVLVDWVVGFSVLPISLKQWFRLAALATPVFPLRHGYNLLYV